MTKALKTAAFWIPLVVLLLMVSLYGVVGKDKVPLLAPSTWTILLSTVLFCAAVIRSNVKIPTATGWFLAYAVYGAVLIPRSAIPGDSMQTLVKVWSALGFYVVATNSIGSFRRAKGLLGILLMFFLVTALYGLIIHFKAPDRVLWTERWFIYEGRLASTYICPNHYAHHLQMLLPFCLVLIFIAQAGIFLRILSAYCFVAFLPPLFFTESRAGWLGSIAAVAVCLCLMALRKSRKLFLMLMIVVPLLAALLLGGAWRFSETFQRRMQPVVEFIQQQSEEGVGSAPKDFRPQTWLDTLGMIKERPWLGYGPGTYGTTFTGFRQHFKSVRLRAVHPHNEYLEITADYGVIGFALFAVGWLWGLGRVLVFSLKTEQQHHALLAMAFVGTAAGTMVHSFFDFQMHVYPNLIMFALLAAIPASLLAGRQKRSPGKRTVKIRPVVCACLAVGWLLFGGKVLGADYLRSMADRSLEQKKEAVAEKYYRGALALDSGNWRACLGMGQILQDRRYDEIDRLRKKEMVVEELEWYERAHALNPVKDDIRLGLARAFIFSGQRERGLVVLRELSQYRKFSDSCQWILGSELRKAGLYEESLEVFLRARTLANTPSINRNISWLKERLAAPAEKDGTPPESVDDAGGIELEGLFDAMMK